MTESEVARLILTLAKIARGRGDSGRPLAGETARQLARDVLIEQGITWPRQRDPGKVEAII
jgi:hypothetical protein